jgi:cysteine-rich repeat protein
MRWIAFLSMWATVGCLADPTVPCGEGKICGEGTVCHQARDADICVTPLQLDACQPPKLEGSACQVAEAAGACVNGACILQLCGDGLVVGDEVCDDRNGTAGDGCSADCRSNERCGNGMVDQIGGEECDSGMIGLSADGCSSTCKVEGFAWSDVSPRGPGVRIGPAVVTDTRNQRVLLFGGASTDGYRNAPWFLPLVVGYH